MKTKRELNQAILAITQEMRQKFPELCKYLDEMPEISSGNDDHEINNDNLKDYRDSLEELLKNYADEHKRSEP